MTPEDLRKAREAARSPENSPESGVAPAEAADEGTTPTEEETKQDLADLPPPKSNYELLGRELEGVINEAFDPLRVWAWVEDARLPITVLDHNGRDPVDPGPLVQLITTAAALDQLGPDYRFRTTLRASGEIVGTTLEGSLIVTGKGDPTIGGRFAPDWRNVTSVFKGWAEDLKGFGIKKIDGDIVGDDTYFDKEYEGPDWPEKYRGEWLLAQVSALSFNENSIDFTFQGARGTGRRAKAEMFPKTDYIIFHNGVLTGKKNSPVEVGFKRQKDSNLLSATGLVPARGTFHGKGSIGDPTAYFITVLRETLKSEGVPVLGESQQTSEDLPDSAFVTSSTWPVSLHVSPPMSEIVGVCNHDSLYFYADMLFKTMGREVADEGSFEGGRQAVRGFLQENALGDSTVEIYDGSGRSRANSLSPRFVVHLLRFMQNHKDGRFFQNSLPVPGGPGTLRNRFQAARSRDPEAPVRVHAVGGALHGTYTLAGYAENAQGAQFAFCFAVSDPRMNPREVNALLDKMAMTVATSKVRGYAKP